MLNVTKNGVKYVRTLENHLLPFSENISVQSVFKQDGAPFHRSKVAKDSPLAN